MHAVTPSVSLDSSPRVWRAVVAASIGNALEWFDLVVYGFFAVTISKLFFPAGNDTVSLLLTLGTFGVSFFMRPLGAIVLGAYADRAGRKAALTLSILLMMAGTLIAKAYPQATFVSTAIAPAGGNKYNVTGKLTIKGKTETLTVPVTVTQAGATQTFDGVLPIRRSAFNVGTGEWKDTSIVADDVQIKFHIVAAK